MSQAQRNGSVLLVYHAESFASYLFPRKKTTRNLFWGDLKEYTSKKLQKEIEDNPRESRKEWLLWMFERAASKSNNVKGKQLWQHHNKPIELWSSHVIDQKVAYIHENPIEAGFVSEAEHWK
ncbi:hypothetical protein [Marinoscillum luteum]|uniref:Transposase n=1 Tax=Marinoscillum luteum TaxID=861051 RepID=A0ABW7NFQ2_9BACT